MVSISNMTGNAMLRYKKNYMLSIIFKSECSGTAKKSKKYINMYYSTFINFRKAWPTAPDDNTTRRFKTYNLTYKAALPHRQYRLNTKKNI